MDLENQIIECCPICKNNVKTNFADYNFGKNRAFYAYCYNCKYKNHIKKIIALDNNNKLYDFTLDFKYNDKEYYISYYEHKTIQITNY